MLSQARIVPFKQDYDNNITSTLNVSISSVDSYVEGRALQGIYTKVFGVVNTRNIGEKREREGFGVFGKWKDGGDNEWVKAKFIGEDLVRDFEAGLEYAVAEGVMG
ncbi:hypothetical protein D5086_009190 [Populus alba]|uniref:Uncharacterized protein n=1 Tax=Populus alba TaxID=43335 RepID=A0ACC4CI20_POPAL